MTTYLPGPRPHGDAEYLRVQRGLLRFVREAAEGRTPLPGEIELTARLACTRQQLRKAMSELESQGIVRRRQGTVTTVDPIALRMSVRLEEQFEHADLLRRLGYRASVERLHAEPSTLTPHIAAVMELDEGSACVVARKRWRADDRVAMIADDTVPLPGELSLDEDESIFALAARAWGEQVVWCVTTPGLTTLQGEIAELFERPEGTPILTLEIVGIGATGRRLLHSFEYHDPDVVSYSLVRTVRPPWGGL